MQNAEFVKKLRYIKQQFLCNVPIKDLCWQGIDELISDFQDELINNTVRLDSVLNFPLNIEYQKLFLKHLLQQLEKKGSAVDDSLYEEYARLVALPKSNVSFKHYLLENGNKNIILKEDIHLISEGTTGLRTWQASLALSEWILGNPAYFNSKKVIELGSGIGLTGLVLALHCKPESVYSTDCHPSVLKSLCDNIILNIEKGSYDINEQFMLHEEINSCAVSVVNLPWENISLELCQKLGKIDIIIAADVVYDKTIFNSLKSAVDFLFKYCSAEQFILSCTVRNCETVNEFISLLSTDYKVSDLEVPDQRNFLWEKAPPVRILSVEPSSEVW